jgi:hypothetical protein
MDSSSVNRALVVFVCTLAVLTISASFYRYVVTKDFLVTYEIDCDPAISICYVGCEDDACTEEYYYQEIERYAPTLLGLCGADISECDAANTCMINEVQCTLASCNPIKTPGECVGPNL